MKRDYNVLENYPYDYANGSFAFKIEVKKAAEYSEYIIIHLDNHKLTYAELAKIDGPMLINYEPAKCSNVVTNIFNKHLLN